MLCNASIGSKDPLTGLHCMRAACFPAVTVFVHMTYGDRVNQ